MLDASLDPTAAGPGPRSAAARVVAAVLMASVVAGAAGAIGETTLDYYKPSPEVAKNTRDPGPLRRELAALTPKNLTIAFGTLAILLGTSLAAAGLVVGRSGGRSAIAGVAGAAIGLVVAGAGSFIMSPIFYNAFDPARPSMLAMIVVRGAIWAAIGAVAGAVYGHSAAGPHAVPRTLLGGLAGAFVATIVFELAHAILDPLDRNDQILPTSTTSRYLAYALVSLLVALGAALSLTHRHPSEKPGQPEPDLGI